jgi:hypothetical protein
MARGFTLARLAVILVALFMVVAQFVPWWLAGHLPPHRVVASPVVGTGRPHLDIAEDHHDHRDLDDDGDHEPIDHDHDTKDGRDRTHGPERR